MLPVRSMPEAAILAPEPHLKRIGQNSLRCPLAHRGKDFLSRVIVRSQCCTLGEEWCPIHHVKRMAKAFDVSEASVRA